MQQRTLGRTGLKISVLGYGSAGMGAVEAEHELPKLLNGMLDGGCTIIDTAECYGNSEELIGACIGHRRAEYAIFTKFGHQSGLPYEDWDPRLAVPSVERSLKRLRTDRLDLLQIHTCSLAQLQAGDLIAELKKAKQAGKCRFIGFSGDGETVRWAVRCGAFDTIQTSLNIADQESADLIPEMERLGLGIIVKKPVAQGAWTKTSTTDVYANRLRALDYDFCKGPRASEIALRFAMTLPAVATILAHTKKSERWAENAAAVDRGPLPPAEFERIRARWRQVADASWVGQT